MTNIIAQSVTSSIFTYFWLPWFWTNQNETNFIWKSSWGSTKLCLRILKFCFKLFIIIFSIFNEWGNFHSFHSKTIPTTLAVCCENPGCVFPSGLFGTEDGSVLCRRNSIGLFSKVLKMENEIGTFQRSPERLWVKDPRTTQWDPVAFALPSQWTPEWRLWVLHPGYEEINKSI